MPRAKKKSRDDSFDDAPEEGSLAEELEDVDFLDDDLDDVDSEDESAVSDDDQDAGDVSDESAEPIEKPKAKPRRRRRTKAKVTEASDADGESAQTGGDENSGEESEDIGKEDTEAVVEEGPPEPPPEPDHQDSVAALNDLGARLELNEHGNAWRLFFYEDHGDDAVAQIHGLNSLKEIWLLGTKVSEKMVAELKEHLPKVKVFH